MINMSDRPIESQQTTTSATQGNGEQQKKKELIAYIYVSSIGQSLEVQRDKMLALGVNREYLFEEKRSGLDSNRPALKEAIRVARKATVLLSPRLTV